MTHPHSFSAMANPGPSCIRRRVGAPADVTRQARPMPHVAWYRRKDYKHIRSIMDDGSKFPKTFDEWERKANRRLASAAAAGVPIQPVILDPSEFLTYYKAKNFSARGDRERNMVRASICKRFEFEKGCIRFRHDAPLAAVAGPGR